jgi:hypothetical protein
VDLFPFQRLQIADFGSPPARPCRRLTGRGRHCSPRHQALQGPVMSTPRRPPPRSPPRAREHRQPAVCSLDGVFMRVARPCVQHLSDRQLKPGRAHPRPAGARPQPPPPTPPFSRSSSTSRSNFSPSAHARICSILAIHCFPLNRYLKSAYLEPRRKLGISCTPSAPRVLWNLVWMEQPSGEEDPLWCALLFVPCTAPICSCSMM